MAGGWTKHSPGTSAAHLSILSLPSVSRWPGCWAPWEVCRTRPSGDLRAWLCAAPGLPGFGALGGPWGRLLTLSLTSVLTVLLLLLRSVNSVGPLGGKPCLLCAHLLGAWLFCGCGARCASSCTRSLHGAATHARASAHAREVVAVSSCCAASPCGGRALSQALREGAPQFSLRSGSSAVWPSCQGL